MIVSVPVMDAKTIHCQIPLLGGLDKELLEQVSAAMRIRRLQRREFVIHKDVAGEGLFFLIQGRLQVVDIDEEGREVGLNFIEPGDFVGEMSVIDEMPPSASVIAVSESIVALLPRAVARQLFFRHPAIAERMMRRLTAKLRSVSALRAILGIPDAFQRVYALIHHFAGPDRGKLITIENMPTHQQISIIANTSRETVTRALRTLVQKGVLEKDLRRLIVRDPEALERAARTGSPEPR